MKSDIEQLLTSLGNVDDINLIVSSKRDTSTLTIVLQAPNTHDVCANCGKEGNDINNICNKCKQVKYCNAACKKKHRQKHKKDCERTVAKLYDIELFKEPPPQYGDCPICFLRLPALCTGSRYMSCCGKVICSGCYYAPVYDNQGNIIAEKKCPFCRTPTSISNEEMIKRDKKRVELDDPIAIYNQGCDYDQGKYGYPQDYTKALAYWHRAAELGLSEAYCSIGYAYDHGEGVEVDKKKAEHYYELAAMKGHVKARDNLGIMEENAGNTERALKHYMIAASAGDNDSLDCIKDMYSDGDATKEDYTKALKSYQIYLDEVKSKQRDEAAAASDDNKYID